MSASTPLMKQYKDIKAEYQDAILLFRMGDFFETFYDDAKEISAILGITLTSRGYGGDHIPLAGFPIKSADSYIVRLVKTGRKIAICEQLEEPKKGVKIVKRGVVEVLTPGTIMRDALLSENENNFIASYAADKAAVASIADISTGQFSILRFDNTEQMQDYLEKGNISEIIEMESIAGFDKPNVRKVPDYYFSREESEGIVKRHFKVATAEGLGLDTDIAVKAAGSLLQYLEDNQKNGLTQIKSISNKSMSEYMTVDSQTMRNLEILRRNNGDYENSFLHTMDRTNTPMGTRMLRQRMMHPFRDRERIERSHSNLNVLTDNNALFIKLQNELRNIGDIERINARIVTQRATPRDVILLGDALSRIPGLKNLAGQLKIRTDDSFTDCCEVQRMIDEVLNRDRVLAGKKEMIIRKGFSSEYDNVLDISVNAAKRIKALEEQEKERTGIGNLRIGFNNITGYYIEITNSHKEKTPIDYVWKQSLKNAERYTNTALKEYEDAILHADDRIHELENSIFMQLQNDIAEFYTRIQQNASVIGELDVLCSFAVIGIENSYIRPEMTDSRDIMIEDGRHPVVENVEKSGKFVPNNLIMDSKTRIILLTGPNMSGKSTYLRQNALIVYMAHLGMFVPAKRAKIPLTDRIFTRIGASDDISRGVSTFMAEMLESANIINNMTDSSFIILDEIGRGTSTFDGLSIAWAIVEYLHDSPAMPNTLFATHYHELTELSVKLERLKNYTAKVRRFEDRIVFMRKVVEGSSDESYGIEVARMAGFPDDILKNAYQILSMLKENEENIKGKIRDIEQLKLFGDFAQPAVSKESEIERLLKETDINTITPVEAILLLEKLKKKIR